MEEGGGGGREGNSCMSHLVLMIYDPASPCFQVVAMASDLGMGEVWFGYDHGDMMGGGGREGVHHL